MGAGAVDVEAVGGSGPGGVVGDVGEQVEPAGRSGEEPLRGVGHEVTVDVSGYQVDLKVQARIMSCSLWIKVA